jgi:hypothetical protein
MHNRLVIYFGLIIVLVFSPLAAVAETLNSDNYQIENPSINVGGESSSSDNYTSTDSIGTEAEGSSASDTYKNFFGFLYPAYPGVPAQPTFTNTGGTLYSSLDFVVATGGNSSDTNYAIAISSDDFVTTNYVQIDDTVGSTAAWQTYANWGSGTGERIVGLSPSTTYKIKVKARFGPDSETGFSITATAATAAPALTITFSGVNSGTSVAGETTTVTSSTNAIPYASLVVGVPAVAAHRLTVSTNASNGYTTTLLQDGELRDGLKQIDPLSATNASPAAWPTSVAAGEFGYHTTDSVLCTGSTNRFAANDTYAKLTTSPEEVACNTAPVTNEATTVVFKLQIGAVQPAGNYQNRLTYITTAQF